MESIRKLDLNDLEQIVELRIAIQNFDFSIANMHKKIDKDILEKETREYVTKNLNNTLYMFGLFIDSKLIANCGFYIDRHFPTYNNKSGVTGYICNVFTKEEYRNKGYQKKVFTKCLDYAKEIGIKKFKLSSINENAINMYKNFGFKANNHIYDLEV